LREGSAPLLRSTIRLLVAEVNSSGAAGQIPRARAALGMAASEGERLVRTP